MRSASTARSPSRPSPHRLSSSVVLWSAPLAIRVHSRDSWATSGSGTMVILVNSLSVTNQSGRHVLLGHLDQVASWSRDRHRFVVLYHAANADIVRDLGATVGWHRAPGWTSNWAGRVLWERVCLGRVAAQVQAGCVFTPSGIAVGGLAVPQVVFCQNPWCLVPGLRRTWREKAKAMLQRRAYRRTVCLGQVMVFNSEFMRRAYERNAGCALGRSVVVYQAADDATFAAAARLRGTVERRPLSIVSVSAMAPYKGAETLVGALGMLRRTLQVPATLTLIGGWPDEAYRRMIEAQVDRLGLRNAVTFAGHVPQEHLHRAYATARVFCLMSRCESFGIPAVEAQCFGTPVVSSRCCAIPEVAGDGGLYPPPGDTEGTAQALGKLLRDDGAWADLSRRAIANAERFRWCLCSRPLLDVFDGLAADGGSVGADGPRGRLPSSGPCQMDLRDRTPY